MERGGIRRGDLGEVGLKPIQPVADRRRDMCELMLDRGIRSRLGEVIPPHRTQWLEGSWNASQGPLLRVNQEVLRGLHL